MVGQAAASGSPEASGNDNPSLLLPLFYPAFPYRHLVSLIPLPSPGHAPVHFRLFLWSSRLLQDEEEEGRSSQREGDSGVSRTRAPLSAPSGSEPEAAYCCGTQSPCLLCLFNWYLTNLRDISLLTLLIPSPVSYQSSVLLKRPQPHKGIPRTCHLPSGDWTASLGSRNEALGLFSG